MSIRWSLSWDEAGSERSSSNTLLCCFPTSSTVIFPPSWGCPSSVVIRDTATANFHPLPFRNCISRRHTSCSPESCLHFLPPNRTKRRSVGWFGSINDQWQCCGALYMPSNSKYALTICGYCVLLSPFYFVHYYWELILKRFFHSLCNKFCSETIIDDRSAWALCKISWNKVSSECHD